jgi:hypothetical protein
MEPAVLSPPTTPFTLQMTAVFPLPFTVAAYCEEVPSVTVVRPLSANVTFGAFGAFRTTEILCATDGSALLVAVIATFEDCGRLAGAV